MISFLSKYRESIRSLGKIMEQMSQSMSIIIIMGKEMVISMITTTTINTVRKNAHLRIQAYQTLIFLQETNEPSANQMASSLIILINQTQTSL